jgi:hypothetical protein
MSFAVAGTAIATIGSSIISSNAQGDAIDAANASSDKNIAYQEKTFNQIKDLLAPFVSAGNQTLGKQLDFLGINGPNAQNGIISSVQNSPYFKTVAKQGEDAILQNASATGGLRGGNTEVALNQFRPQLLNQLLEQYYSKLGGLTSSGQNAAAFTGTAANNAAGTVSNILTNQGDNNASAILAQGKTNAGLFNIIPSSLGSFLGSGGSFGSSPSSYDGIAAAGGIRIPGGF